MKPLRPGQLKPRKLKHLIKQGAAEQTVPEADPLCGPMERWATIAVRDYYSWQAQKWARKNAARWNHGRSAKDRARAKRYARRISKRYGGASSWQEIGGVLARVAASIAAVFA